MIVVWLSIPHFPRRISSFCFGTMSRTTVSHSSVVQTLSHIGVITAFQSYVQQNHIDDMTKMNFPELIQKMRAEEEKPRTKDEIIAFLKAEGDTFATYVESLPESFLAQPVQMPP